MSSSEEGLTRPPPDAGRQSWGGRGGKRFLAAIRLITSNQLETILANETHAAHTSSEASLRTASCTGHAASLLATLAPAIASSSTMRTSSCSVALQQPPPARNRPNLNAHELPSGHDRKRASGC